MIEAIRRIAATRNDATPQNHRLRFTESIDTIMYAGAGCFRGETISAT
jgi:hypothetical protein